MLRYISSRLSKCTFANFATDSAESKKAKGIAVSWLLGFKDGAHDGLMLYGPKGTGKTHLLAAICNELPKDVYYWAPVGELLDAMQPGSVAQETRKKAIACWSACYGSCGTLRYGTEHITSSYVCSYCPGLGGDLIDQVQQAKLLVLDDLGTRANNSTSDWVHDRLFNIINYRYDNELPILVSTNYSLGELSERLGHERISSRLTEMCKVVRLQGDDYRVKLRREANQMLG
jgi:DNA replication protein DnaC